MHNLKSTYQDEPAPSPENWIQLTIHTTTSGIEPVSGRLYQIGITGIEIEDAVDFNDFLENSKEFWDYVDEPLMKKATAPTCIKVYISDNATGLETLSQIKSTLSDLAKIDPPRTFGTLEMSFTNMSEQDWAENWKQYYKPLNVGKKILIKPEWEDVCDTCGRIVFEINPGMSFGTGTHQSTQLCIELMENHIKDGDFVLDLGCGSGILSIIAILLGANSAIAVDIDPNAAKIASENAALNGVTSNNYTTIAGNVLSDAILQQQLAARQYDMVLANIVADVIIPLSPLVLNLLKSGGIFVTSGIIIDRLDEVKAAIEQCGLKIIETRTKDDWAAVLAVK